VKEQRSGTPEHSSAGLIRLYIAGDGSNSRKAAENLHRFLKKNTEYPASVQTIDVLETPRNDLDHDIHLVPALLILQPVKTGPVFGTLSDPSILENLIRSPNRSSSKEHSGSPAAAALEAIKSGQADLVLGAENDLIIRPADDDLSDSHQRLLTILDSIDAAIYVADMDTYEILFMNQHMRSSFGSNLVGETCYKVFRAEDKPCTDCTNKKLLDADGKPVGVVVWEGRNPVTGTYYINYDRAVQWVDGRMVRLQVSTDITGHRQAEEALREAVLKQKEAVRAANVGLWDWDLITNRVSYSAEWKRQIGYQEHEIGDELEEWISRIHPDDLEQTLEMSHQSLYLGHKYQEVEFRLRHRDGTYRWILSRGSVIRDNNGRPVRMLGSHVDITERLQAEKALRESERQKELILNTAGETIDYYDPGLRVIWVNRASAEAAGLRPEDMVGRHCYEIWHQRNEPCDNCHVLRTLYKKLPQQAETTTNDGRSWKMKSYPVLDRQGNVTALVEFGQDITGSKLAEQEKERLTEQFHQAQKLESVGRLAGGVAHDLNNLLTPILGYSEMLLTDAAAYDPRRESLEEIVSAGRRARDLVRQLLAFSRKQTMELKNIDLNVLIRNFENLLRRTIREDVAISLELAPDLPLIRADVGQLEQVVMNLAVNAQDAMPEGGRMSIATNRAEYHETHACCDEKIAPGEYVVLSVSDNGCGMDEATRSHLFEPFFTTKEQGKGTGLGLATVYGIVKQHGGSISVHTAPGKGTTMKLHFPVSSSPALSGKRCVQAGENPCGSETIVLVEDEEKVLKLVLSILLNQGYTVFPASGGKEALDMLAAHEGAVHLLLTDVVMPEMNGKQLYGQVKRMYPDIKVLYMSGYTDEVIVRHGAMEEGGRFIQKPFSSQALAVMVRRVLDQKTS
jgi:PAS domain S-box-containing protein